MENMLEGDLARQTVKYNCLGLLMDDDGLKV